VMTGTTQQQKQDVKYRTDIHDILFLQTGGLSNGFKITGKIIGLAPILARIKS